jgi:hypothetical protein
MKYYHTALGGLIAVPDGVTFPSTGLQEITEEEYLALKASPTAQIEPEEPTVTLESLQEENKLLKAQVQAQSDRSDFLEDCIAEMALEIY